jgi:hypothetical protein
MFIRASLTAVLVSALADGVSAQENTPAVSEIKAFLTPGFVTTITYPSTLKCPASMSTMMPEKATRIVASGSAHPQCHIDEKGRISGCTKSEEAGSADLYFPTGAAFMVEKCRLGDEISSPTDMAFEIKFNTTAR